MNEIVRTINSINQILESPLGQRLSDQYESQLIDIVDILILFIDSNSTKKESIRLICRQLNRLMDYNGLLSMIFWMEFHDNIRYVLDETNSKQGMGRSWDRFNRMINFETELEQRELEFHQKIRKQKSLNELFCEHQEFFEEYLRKCISIHSKIKVQNLLENIDDQLTQISINSESQNRIREKLQSIEINFDCSNRSFENLNPRFSENNNLSIFLPSIEHIEANRSNKSEQITNILLCNRWIVILGDPGSAKTTLLRWITCTFAESALHGHDSVVLNGNDSIPVRIPILIRIGEFATWINQYSTKTLMDYIGEHTWNSILYCHDDRKHVFKELIDHGHALILLDGFDEINDIGQRKTIVDLVQKFLDQHVRAPDFISPFDDKMFNDTSSYYNYGKIVETQQPSISGGNQIIITSRIVGYKMCPIIGSFIQHYALLLMNYQEANQFTKNWIVQTEKFFFNEKIIFDEQFFNKRSIAMEKIFQNGSEVLLSNPSLLSLICTFIFQSPDEFHPKSRIEVYYHAAQVTLRSWKSSQSNISEMILTNFLIDLACYIHLNSPSGLIDEFDTKQLCYMVLQQQNLGCDRKILRKYVNKLISLLDFNIGIFAERGLQIFGFIHLSFQEYFVAQSLIKGSSDEVAKRILTIIIHPRFHQSLLLAIGWISWKWSLNDYDQFCYLLITSNTEYSIPFGTILFFDSFNDMQRLPSNSIIFIGLNTILDHQYYPNRNEYLISNLLKLNESIIIEWIQSQLKDEKRLYKFCQCLLNKTEKLDNQIPVFPSFIYQQLFKLHNISPTTELIIDQTLRTKILSDKISHPIFNNYLSNDISLSNIHPLIISVIIAVLGGIDFRDDDDEIMNIELSIEQMHRESSILTPIIEYFNNNKEPQIETLIHQYENFIQKSSPSNISNDIVDSFIVLICLKGVGQTLFYQKYFQYKALSLALERLKRTWFYLKKSCNDKWNKISFIGSQIELIIDELVLQSNQQRISFSIACKSAWEKLGIESQTIWLNGDDFQYQSVFINVINEDMLDQIIHSQKNRFFLINFLPKSLQQLYKYTIISPINKTDSLPLIIFLSQCLTHLEYFNNCDLNIYLVLPILYPLLKECMLENYAKILFSEKYSDYTSILDKNCKKLLEIIEDCQLLDPFLIDPKNDLKIFINIERQRIHQAKQTQQKDFQLFASSISLARLFQAKYRSHSINTFIINSTESKEIHFAIMDIFDPILRIISLSIILDMKDPLIFDEEQRDQLRYEMISQLQSLLPNISLLIATVLFIQCYKAAHQFHPLAFQEMAKIIVEKFNNNSSQSKQAAFIALKQVKNLDFLQFIKREENLFDLLQFNSTKFLDYFNKTTSLNSSNNILLSLMYLIELTFDSQILQMDVKVNQINILSLWNESSKDKKIITYKIAIWITNNLQNLNSKDLHQLIHDVSKCLMIEKKAFIEIKKWLNYRMDKLRNFFAYYAALQLFIEGSNIPDLIDIINEMFVTDNKFRFKSILEDFINDSRLVNSIVLRQMLIILHKNIHHYSDFSISISSKEMFELFLNLELERIISNLSFKSFLSIITDCSTDFTLYLVENFRLYLKFENDEYLAVIIKWIDKNLAKNDNFDFNNFEFSIEFYKYIFTIFDGVQFPLVFKVVLNALYSVYTGLLGGGIDIFARDETIFLKNDIIIYLENIIYSWYKYSEDVLSICLLTYGNYLIKLHKSQMNRNISNEMKNILRILSNQSSLELISIRATFCLIFIEHSDLSFPTISKWFINTSNITSEKLYKILLQKTLYRVTNSSHFAFSDEIINHLEAHSTELIDLFVIDLYNYLCNKDKIDYFNDSVPSYIGIAREFSEKKLDEFRSAVQRSFFGENKFKRQLYLCYKNNPIGCKEFIYLYAIFGILTMELVEMCEEYTDDPLFGIEVLDPNLSYLKEVSHRDVIEKLFQILDLKIYDRKFKTSLWILRYLVKRDMISLLEAHQRIPIIDIISDGDDNYIWKSETYIFDSLLNVSCFNEGVLSNFEKVFFTKNDIDEEFEKTKDNIDKKLILFCQNK